MGTSFQAVDLGLNYLDDGVSDVVLSISQSAVWFIFQGAEAKERDLYRHPF